MTTLETVHTTYKRWLGDSYDLDVLDVVLAVASGVRLSGDPAWLLVVGGSGVAKTETVVPLAGAGAHVTSSLSSAGALLSASPKRETNGTSTGGLLRKVGDSGIVVLKDFTTVLSMSREPRAEVLAALREVYDGRWERNVGVDGGRTLTWTGRLVVIGAVTTAYDTAHAVISSMGDRFLLVRLDSTTGRGDAGRKAIRNAGREAGMRAELSKVVGELLAGATNVAVDLEDDDIEVILGLADVVTLARTAVERDYRGEVIDAHAPEMPTRFAKQLTMVVRGALALGISKPRAMALACRVARDSVPPLRLALLLDLLDHPASTTHAVRVRLDKPRTTVDQNLQALHLLGLVTVDELVENGKTVWRYSVSTLADKNALGQLGTSTGNVITSTQEHKEEGFSFDLSDISRTTSGVSW